MEKVSAMKKVALFLMIVGLAVAMVACQGAVGPKGDKGDDGDDGADGVSGAPGEPGKSPLYATAGTAAPILLYINDGEEADAPGDAETVTLSEHFSGGIGDVTVGDAVVDSEIETDAQIFTVDTEDGEVTFAIRMNTADPPAPAADNQRLAQDYTVEITDSAGPSLTLTITVRRNLPPANFTVAAFTLGTDETELEDPRTGGGISCDSHNMCTLTVTTGTDPDSNALGDELSYTAMTDSDKLEVVSEDGNEIVFRGLATTDNANADDSDDTVEVTIVATDLGGLTNEATVAVTVDGAPTGDIPDQTIDYSATAQVVITNLDAFFTDPDGDDDDLTYMVKPDSVDATKATVTIDNTLALPTLSVTPAVATGGTTQVTIVVTEGAGGLTPPQSGEATFTLTVNP